MIKVLILDDGYHSKEAVMLTNNEAITKMDLARFINAYLCVPHNVEYQIKTAHYEDIFDDSLSELFDNLDNMSCSNKNLVQSFEKLYDSDEVVDGCDIY